MSKAYCASFVALMMLLGPISASQADLIDLTWDDGSGLAVRATFEQLDARVMRVTVWNISTSMPVDLDGDTSNQLLTSISFDLGDGIGITNGTAILGAGAATVNFDNVPAQLGPGDDVSAEWGYGNSTQNAPLAYNFITTNQAHSTRFTSGNLDGPTNLSGPQGGLLASPPLMDIGGLGGITGPVVFTLDLNDDWNIATFSPASAVVEFGSDAAFLSNPVVSVPEPGAVALFAIGGLCLGAARIRRRLTA